jgi:hypothetical protein
MALAKSDIEKLFHLLDRELHRHGTIGELYLVGGAVMCLVFDARPSTKDIDALFKPAAQLRAAATAVAMETGLDDNWLNDAVKRYLSGAGEFDVYLELENLRVFAANASYLFAMKCLAMRLGEEFHDLDDARYLIRHLGLTSHQAALALIEQYYPRDRIPQKTLYILEELLPGSRV